MILCQMDSTIIQTHRYFDSEWFQCCLHRFGSPTTLKTTKNQIPNPPVEPEDQKCQLWPPQRVPSTHFFKQNLIHIILGYRWVDLDTYIGHIWPIWKNGHFSTGPPTSGRPPLQCLAMVGCCVLCSAEAAAKPPAANQWQHHLENVYISKKLGLI